MVLGMDEQNDGQTDRQIDSVIHSSELVLSEGSHNLIDKNNSPSQLCDIYSYIYIIDIERYHLFILSTRASAA